MSPRTDENEPQRRSRDEDERPRRRQRVEREDDEDDDYENRPRRRRESEVDVTGGLIPYKNGYALISYYLGVFSLIPIAGMVLGPAAIILGFLGLSAAKKKPKVQGKTHAIVGLVLGFLGAGYHLAIVAAFIAAIIFAKK